jgi:hypothetical protein
MERGDKGDNGSHRPGQSGAARGFVTLVTFTGGAARYRGSPDPAKER